MPRLASVTSQNTLGTVDRLLLRIGPFIKKTNPVPNTYNNTGNRFGDQIVITSRYIIIAAPFQSFDAGLQTWNGQVYVFDINSLDLVHTIVCPGGNSERFGFGLAAWGNTLVIGAPVANTNGTVYVYNLITGTQEFEITNPDNGGDAASPNGSADFFGGSVDVNKDYILVGARFEYDSVNNYFDQGVAYLFNRSTGALVATLQNPDPRGNDHFGYKVAMTDDYAIIGAPNMLQASRVQGFAFKFDLTNSLANISTPTTISNPQPLQGRFGGAIAVSDSKYAIGGYASTNFASIRVFDASTDEYLYAVANPISGSIGGYGDLQGNTLAITDRYMIVGDPRQDLSANVSETDAGRVFIYDIETGKILKIINNPNHNGDDKEDYFGLGVQVSDDNAIFAAAAPQDDIAAAQGGNNAGVAYISKVNNLFNIQNINTNSFTNYTNLRDSTGTHTLGRIYSVFFDPSGTQLFINSTIPGLSSINKYHLHYECRKPWDISTAENVFQFTYTTTTGYPGQSSWSPNGRVFFDGLRYSSNNVRSIVYGGEPEYSFGTSTSVNSPSISTGMDGKWSDGTYLYFTESSGSIRRITLDGNGEIVSGTNGITTWSQTFNCGTLQWCDNGNYLFVAEYNASNIYRFDRTSSPYSIATNMTNDQSVTLTDDVFHVSHHGVYLYIGETDGTIQRYSMV